MLAFVLRNRLALINLGLWVLFFWLFYLGLRWVVPFILPLLIGSFIAILLEPIIKLWLKLRIPRWTAAGGTILLVFAGFTGLLAFLGARLMIELAGFINYVPTLMNRFSAQTLDAFHRATEFYGTLSPDMAAQVKKNLTDLAKMLSDWAQAIASSALHALGNIPSLLTITLLSLLIAFFIAKDYPLWKGRILRYVSPSIREKGSVVLDDLSKAVFGYFRAQAILITITFMQVLIGLMILQVDYAFMLSLLAAFLDILPLLGTGSLFVPWALYLILFGGNLKLGIGLFVLYALIVIVRQLLEPKILADSIGLDPLPTLIGMYAGYQALGFVGLLAAPFLIIVFTSLLKVQAFHFLLDPDTTDDQPPKIHW
jgi:sporulation integral membrane protein YtvI